MERRVLIGIVAGTLFVAGLLLPGLRPVSPPLPVPAPARNLPAGPVRPLQGVMVVLDPGHGGEDPGAVCGPVSEAALTYRTAAELGAGLRAQGADVVYTVHSRRLAPDLAAIEPPPAPPTDAVMAVTGRPLRLRHGPEPLWMRADKARQIWVQRVRWDSNAGRDVFFLSLHYDSFRGRGVSGSVVCVDRRVRQMPTLAIVLAGEMAQGRFGRACEFHGVPGVSGHELGVLNPQHNPIPEKVLLEVTTISNTQDALQAGDPLWRAEIARRIVNAITLVHQQTQGNLRSPPGAGGGKSRAVRADHGRNMLSGCAPGADRLGAAVVTVGRDLYTAEAPRG